MTKKPEKNLSYEEAFAGLESIVSQLENEEPPLDQLVQEYERGMELLKTCRTRLNEAALRIEKVKNDEAASLEPFDPENTSETRHD